MRIAYFVNQYPATSHTFIRREIRALEGLAVTVVRYAIRPTSERVVHFEDAAEREQTRYILDATIFELFRAALLATLKTPRAFIRMLSLALKTGRRSDRGLLRHLAYAIEATVLAHWSGRDQIQHVHAHFGTNSATIAMLASQLSGIPFSFTAHGSEEFEKAPLLSLDEKVRRSKFAVCVSSFGRSQLMRWSSPTEWKKIELIRCGLDDAFLNVEVPALPAVPRLVCVGRLGEHKAQLILVGAVRRLRAAGVYCQVVFAGDGPMRADVEETIRRDQLEDQITITGWVSTERVKEEIAAARALVLPSFSENMPVVIMEAMALGRPVISTYVAGIPELVRPGETGWLVPASDESALAEAMRHALTLPIKRLTEMGTAGRSRVIEHHDARKEAEKLKRLFGAAS